MAEMTALPHPLTEDLAEAIARRLQALAEPMRLRLLDLLRDGEVSCGELADRLSTSQQNASKHLVLLTDLGIVTRRRDGNRILYSIEDENVLAICELVCHSMHLQLAHRSALLNATKQTAKGEST